MPSILIVFFMVVSPFDSSFWAILSAISAAAVLCSIIPPFPVVCKFAVPLSCFHFGVKNRRRSAFDTTDTEEKLIAAAPIIGFNKIWNTGYSTPAATGMPIAL